MRHLAHNVRYSVIPINPSLLTVTLYSSLITTQDILSLSWRFNRVRLYVHNIIFSMQYFMNSENYVDLNSLWGLCRLP
jgi:hypothetical protein